MKRYKINNRIITADSPTKALKIAKALDAHCKDRIGKIYWNDVRNFCIKNDWYTYGDIYAYNKMLYAADHGTWSTEQIAKDIAEHSRPDVRAIDVLKEINKLNIKDSDIEYLTKEEERAVEDYRKAIAGTTNPKLLELYKHILDEELEHIKELEQANNVEDSKTKDWATPYAIWVKKNGKWLIFGGANSTNIDKRRFLNSGYEDVTVVENGKEPTNDSYDKLKDGNVNGSYAIRNGLVYVYINYKLVGTFASIQAAKDVGYNLDNYTRL